MRKSSGVLGSIIAWVFVLASHEASAISDASSRKQAEILSRKFYDPVKFESCNLTLNFTRGALHKRSQGAEDFQWTFTAVPLVCFENTDFELCYELGKLAKRRSDRGLDWPWIELKKASSLSPWTHPQRTHSNWDHLRRYGIFRKPHQHRIHYALADCIVGYGSLCEQSQATLRFEIYAHAAWGKLYPKRIAEVVWGDVEFSSDGLKMSYRPTGAGLSVTKYDPHQRKIAFPGARAGCLNYSPGRGIGNGVTHHFVNQGHFSVFHFCERPNENSDQYQSVGWMETEAKWDCE